MKFKLNGCSYDDNFYVTEKVSPTFDLILGLKFLDRHSYCLGSENGRRYFKIDNIIVPLLETAVSKDVHAIYGLKTFQMQFPVFSYKVLTLEKFILRPQMCAFVDMYTESKNEHICNAFVEPLDHELGFLIPPQLIILDKTHAKIVFK